MRATIKLTLDGLTRALRARAHQMADEIESGYARARRENKVPPREGRDTRKDEDDVSGD